MSRTLSSDVRESVSIATAVDEMSTTTTLVYSKIPNVTQGYSVAFFGTLNGILSILLINYCKCMKFKAFFWNELNIEKAAKRLLHYSGRLHFNYNNLFGSVSRGCDCLDAEVFSKVFTEEDQ